ncbi:BREX-1 system adenine-specific DNA-methyltransferase PglX [Mariprofundus ferrooxydans]|uniref:BREX-1 system adenine-specific DNA-methyltransferase PglX n=1 Tax=Mariprofundus ferrooxydans TaxID=314344 RepID=UPI000A5526ED|nr:BREX-1 system adenine-specific DNA-methyltransferase PglX [Mariprofundus ferrooxydans]
MSASKYFFRASASDFEKIPNCPIVYWASKKIIRLFEQYPPLSKEIETREGLTTGSNDLFLRLWYEVELEQVGFSMADSNAAKSSGKRYFCYVKGGEFRRWSGNFEYVVNWENDGEELRVFIDPTTGRIRSHNYNGEYAFRQGFTWSGISSGTFAVRHVPSGFMFDAKGPMGFALDMNEQPIYESFLNSVVTNHLIKMLAPTLDFKLGHILNLPLKSVIIDRKVMGVATNAINLANIDWNSYETSWDFTSLPLLQSEYRQATLKETYQKLRLHWFNMTMKMQQLEEENNRIFIEAYGLQDELTPDVPLKEITLTCNPHYRYGGDKTAVELESLLLADTMKEFISYAVGCMFGRYSLDKEGLILANQGETLADYLKQVPEPTFMPDDDNVIPVLDGEWFTDDVTERFRRFVKVTFGDEYYQENLAFIEQSIGKDIRKYFLKDFYADHVKRYKKRPIYWMFSSPKGSFNALIYMHRYQPTTASVVLNGYLREFRTKLIARKEHLEQVSISASVSQRDKTNALKEIEKLKKMIDELESWERDVLYPLAAEQIEIDLDDGVKVNYPKFGKALKKVAGLS